MAENYSSQNYNAFGINEAQLIKLFELDQNNVESIEPLTVTQKDLYLSSLFSPETLLNSGGQRLNISGEINVSTFKAAVLDICDNTTTLRSRIYHCNQSNLEIAYRVIFKKLNANFEYMDLSNRHAHEKQIERLVRNEIYCSYNIEKDYLYKFLLIKLRHNKYIFVSRANHILVDGTSGALLTNAILKNYQAKQSNQAKPEFYLCNNYNDFIDEQSDKFDNRKTIDYWQKALSKVERLETKTDGISGTNICKTLLINSEDYVNLTQFCNKSKYSLSTALKTIYLLLVKSTCNIERDCLITEVLSGRKRKYRNTIGVFNYLHPVICPSDILAEEKQIVDILHHIANDLLRHRSLSKISLLQQNKLSPDNTLNFIYNYYNFGNTYQLSDCTLDSQLHPPLQEKNTVQLIAYERDLGLEIKFYFNSQCYNDYKFLERFNSLLKQISSIAKKVKDLDFLLKDERKLLLTDFNETRNAFSFSQNISDVFEKQALDSPEKIAVTHNELTISYGSLNRRANQIARLLIHNGVSKNHSVAVFLERSIDMLASIFAIWKIGAVFIPVAPEYPTNRIGHILCSSSVKLVLTEKNLLSKIPDTLSEFNPSKICIDGEKKLLDQLSTLDFPQKPINIASTAYTIYTSGSTGKPKGVMVSQLSLLNFLMAVQSALNITEADTFLASTTIGFDIAILELILPLLIGGRTVISSNIEILDREKLSTLISDNAITVLQATPSAWKLLLSTGWKPETGINGPLKILCGGEAMPPALANDFLNENIELYNMYGPTETTIWSTIYPVKKTVSTQRVPIGRPIANTSIFILDRNKRPLPLGMVGELWIGGKGLAQGYVGANEESRPAFIDNPFIESDPTKSKKLYRTGDLARYLTDGNIEYIGRIDHQVKIRGARIELAEIEANLNKHPMVSESLVLAHMEKEMSLLVAYYTTGDNCQADSHDLQAHLKKYLPSYMVPATYTYIDRFPLNVNGKIDRKALPPPEIPVNSTSSYVAPRNHTEHVLTEIWSELFEAERIGIQDNFFELGGHSLLAAQIISRIREAFQIELTLEAIFNSPTIAELAVRLLETKISEMDGGDVAEAWREVFGTDTNL